MTDIAALRERIEALPWEVHGDGEKQVLRASVLALLADTPSVEPGGLSEALDRLIVEMVATGRWTVRDAQTDLAPVFDFIEFRSALPTQASDSPEKP